MEPMTPFRMTLLGPLTRSEEILQFERLRHQIHIVEALRGLKIATPATHMHRKAEASISWRNLEVIQLGDLVMDQVQDGKLLKCRTVVEPLLFGSLQTLVEELDGGTKVMMLSIDNYVHGMNVMELGVLFPVGRELWIRNPCVKTHEGRAMIQVRDPINLKVRQTPREIERIMEHGPGDAKGWKTKGNELVKRGRLKEAVEAYRTGMNYAGGNEKLHASLYRKRAEVLFYLQLYQSARQDAQTSLAIWPNDKTLFILAKTLLQLRSYSKALKHIQQIQKPDSGAETLLGQLQTCELEYRKGVYNNVKIMEEAHLDDRVVHADHVSPCVELRASAMAGRGLFANEDIPAGALLLASKAVLCVYADEVTKSPSEDNADEDTLFDSVREKVVSKLVNMLNNGTARRILQLAGGSESQDTFSIDLRRDDVYDHEVHFLAAQIKDIVDRNSFGGTQRSHLLVKAASDNGTQLSKTGGGALFYAPSFLNHNCVPNATYSTIGDMMFVMANRDIERDEELMIHYLYAERMGEAERDETLQRVWGFSCHCELCEWEREEAETCSAAEDILDKAIAASKANSNPEASLKKLFAAKKKLYQAYHLSVPQIDPTTALESPPPVPPPSLARFLVLLSRQITKENLRSSLRDLESYPVFMAEYHFLHESYSHFERVGVAGLPALRVWEALYLASSASEQVIDAWLSAAHKAHDRLLGDGHFYHQHGKFIKEIKERKRESESE
jgi:hypothetical protein